MQVEYRLSVGGQNFEGAEGNRTTDGQRINVAISNVGGPGGETFSLNSRFSHELEHARQFDNGEFTFVKGPDGKWHPNYTTYDIGDEVKAWKAQLNTATASDFWKTQGGQRKPSLLRDFANAKTTMSVQACWHEVLTQTGTPGRIAILSMLAKRTTSRGN